MESDESDNDHRNGHSSDEDGHGSDEDGRGSDEDGRGSEMGAAAVDKGDPLSVNEEIKDPNDDSKSKERIDDQEPNHSNDEDDDYDEGEIDLSESSMSSDLAESMEQESSEQPKTS